jgi:hypothetical protein
MRSKGRQRARIGRFDMQTTDRASDRILRNAFWASPTSRGPAQVIALSTWRSAQANDLR